jgi:hypothetical protein
VAERLRAASCVAWGSTLTSGTVGPVRGGYCLIEESGLSDLSLARLLGRTEDLSVACGDCGARNRVVGRRSRTLVEIQHVTRVVSMGTGFGASRVGPVRDRRR